MNRSDVPIPPDPSDAHLAALAAHRGPVDRAAAQVAFHELYERYARLMIAFLAARIPSADVDDVAQTVWVRVWQGLPAQFDGSHFRGWLFQIARNLVIDHGRRKRTGEIDRIDERADERAAHVDAAFIEREERVRLDRCLDKLSPEYREVVMGRLGGDEYDVISQRLDIPAGRAHKLFFEAKALLQACVQRGDR